MTREDVMREPGMVPPGWMWTTLGQAAHLNPRDPTLRDLPDHLPVSFLPMVAVDAEQGCIVAPVVRPLSEVRKGFTAFANGDVLFAKITPCMENGKAAIARDLKNGLGFGSTEFHVLRPEAGVLAEWLFHLVRQENFRKDAKAHFAGTAGQLRVPSAFLDSYPIPLPPLPEQRRIVAEIEKQFTRLDAGVAALKRIQANLRRYRASVLKAACEGRLAPQDPTDEPADRLLARILAERRAKWEAEHPGKKYVKPAAPETDGLPELPEGWCWASLGQLAWDAGYGTSQKCDYEASGPPVLRIPNIAKGRIDLNDLKYATLPDELNYAEALTPGDLIIIRTNGSKDLIGRSAVVRDTFVEPHFFASYLIRFRLLAAPTVPEWLGTVWNASLIRRQIEGIAATSAGQYNVSMGALGKLPMPLPPLPEQHRIVAEVERRLSVVQEVEAAVTAALARAGRLRQAVLKRAFEGRLVGQDPSEEAAEVLLEKVRTASVADAVARKTAVIGQERLPGLVP